MSHRRLHAELGPSQRQLRVAETVRHALSDVLLHGDEIVPELARMAITVSEVRLSPDLRQATAYVLPLGGHEAEAALSVLRKAQPFFRREVARRVRLKFAPEIRFIIDESFDRMDATRRLFSDPLVARDLVSSAQKPEVDEEE